MLFSASQLSTHMQCPLQGYFKYHQRLSSEQSGAASYGTIMHYVIEQIDKGMPYDEAEDLFKKLWAEPERLGVKPDYFPARTSYDSYRKKGIDTIHGYEEMRSWGKPQIIASEYSYLVPFGDHEIRGRIDRLDLRKTSKGMALCVVDFKTSARKPTKFDLRTDLQHTVYSYAIKQKQFWTGIPGNPNYLGFADGEEVWEQIMDMRHAGIWLQLGSSCSEMDVGDRGEMDFRQLYRLCDEVARAHKHNVFIPKISSSTCGTCDFFDVCGIDIPKPPLDVKIDDPTRVV